MKIIIKILKFLDFNSPLSDGIIKVCNMNDNKYTEVSGFKFTLCQFVLKILSKNKILTSIKGSNSVANLQKNKDLQYQHRSCQ